MTMFFLCSIWNDRCEDIFVDIAVFNSDSGGGKFAEKSSTEQWLQRGGEFMNHSLYEVAAKCFNRGKNYHMEKIAKAYQSALLASRFVFFLLCKHLKFIGIWRRMIKKNKSYCEKRGRISNTNIYWSQFSDIFWSFWVLLHIYVFFAMSLVT